MLQAGGLMMAAGGGETDPYWAQVVLLISGAGADGAAPTDAKGNTLTTSTGTPAISTTQSKWGFGSLRIATSDRLTSPAGPWGMSSDLSVEYWCYRLTGDTSDSQVAGTLSSGASSNAWGLANSAGGGNVPTLYNLGGGLAASSVPVSLNTWTHIAATRNGSDYRIFLDGVLRGSSTTSRDLSANLSLLIGSRVAEARTNCYINDLRITNGVSRAINNSGTWTYPVPTGPLPQQ